jgi:hypothetical protein
LIIIISSLSFLVLRGFGLGQWNKTLESDQKKETSQSAEASSAADPEANPKTETAPLDGILITKSEIEALNNKAVLAAAIDNHFDARPQYNLNKADLVYEMLAEGGITRLLAFYLRQQPEQIGPIRSARNYMLDWVSEFNALFAHVGGSNDALSKIATYGIRDLNQFSVGNAAYWRGNDKIAPHNMYASTPKLWSFAESRNLNKTQSFDSWKFKEDTSEKERSASQQISFNFGFSGGTQYGVRWIYDPINNIYQRENGGIEHKDAATGQPIVAKNIIFQFTNQYPAGDAENHLVIETQGEGKALIFHDGKIIEGTWKKEDRGSRTKFYTLEGIEAEFNRGTSWVEVVVNGTTVEYT